MQLIARFDEAAKQLIAAGGVLQGLFFAVVALGSWKNAFPFPLWLVPIFFFPLLAQIYCAAKVICTVPLKMEAKDTYILMQRVGTVGVEEGEILGAIAIWCKAVDGMALKKHWWLRFANMLFLLSSLITLLLLLGLAFMARSQ